MSYILGDTLYTANVGDRCVWLCVRMTLSCMDSGNLTARTGSRCYVGTIEASGRLVLNPLSTDHSPNQYVLLRGCCRSVS